MIQNIRGRIRGLRDPRKLPGTTFPPPVEIGVEDPNALDFDGSTEALVNATNNSIGIADTWSIVVWLKPDALGNTSVTRYLLHIQTGATTTNRIAFFHNGFSQFEVSIGTSGGSPLKRYLWSDSPLSAATWGHLVVTWDGTNLKLYEDGTEDTSPTKSTDAAGSMTDTSRQVRIGTNTAAGSQRFDGRLHSTAIFDVVLDQSNITEIFDGKGAFDLRVDEGNYDQSANLQHYYRHGFNASDIGEDLGEASTLIDVGDDAINIDASDIVTDSPA